MQTSTDAMIRAAVYYMKLTRQHVQFTGTLTGVLTLTMFPSWSMTLSREATDLVLILLSDGQLNMCSLSHEHSCCFISCLLLSGLFSNFSTQLSSAKILSKLLLI